ncbi:MAG: monofunctional biosynthetic peptidoglycan transglycosylase [Pseudomonadota bacterium]
MTYGWKSFDDQERGGAEHGRAAGSAFDRLSRRVADRAAARDAAEAIRAALTADELNAALAHEQALRSGRSPGPATMERAARPSLAGTKAAGRSRSEKTGKATVGKKPSGSGRAKKRQGSRRGGTGTSRGLLGRALRRVRRWLLWPLKALGMLLLGLVLLFVSAVALTRWIDPPGGLYMAQERWRLGAIERQWAEIDTLPPHVPRSAVAAEDARFCSHSGIDWESLGEAVGDYLDGTRVRGASSITQQTAKNLWLWHGRSLLRKGLELPFTGLMELLWGKERILEVYLNIAEFDEGVFGINAAARHYYGMPAASLSAQEAARLMTLLPSPKRRDPHRFGAALSRRANQIASGAETIAARGDDGCFTE